ncbi:MAG: 2-succinyl-5-enolpyruvyl-6-hydroxy-3-cyclohexene-1-carboxylic-acid synthase [Dehalococcoidia bacterium]
MTASSAAVAEQAVRVFTRQLRRSGVQHVVIAPGSRSTPLTLAFARDEGFRPWLHLDERSAGYFALGLARQLRAPVALVCTSGTAAANFMPAVVEAYLSRVPLVVLTADRPPELYDVGANQTIDQGRLFGTHVKWNATMPIADGSEALLRHVAAVGARAVAAAESAPAGPVHVNVPFREPLLDGSPPLPLPGGEELAVTRPEAARPSTDALARLIPLCLGRGVIVCGPEAYGLPAEGIADLARVLGWPVLADPLSGVRAGRHRQGHIVEAYEALLRVPEFVRATQPAVVLRFGAMPTSKPLMQYMAGLRDATQVIVDAAGGWRDADASGSIHVQADAAAFCAHLGAAMARRRPMVGTGAADDPMRGAAPPPDQDWLDLWMSANRATRLALRQAVDAIDEPFEGRVPVELASALPGGSTLVVGNSMPVRDMDAFFPLVPRDVRVVGTRGASGIDGVVSTAAGAAAAGAGPVVLTIGDLSFFHDLNGLWALKRHSLSLTVVLVNNDGGGIFHFLPQAEAAPDQFEEWFGTPHGLEFRGAVEMHGGRFESIEATRGWEALLRAAMARKGLTVLELRTERTRNVVLHRQVWAHVAKAVRASLEASRAAGVLS